MLRFEGSTLTRAGSQGGGGRIERKRRVASRWCVLLVVALVTGCGVFGGDKPIQSRVIEFEVAQGANQDSPIAIDIVYVYDQQLVPQLTQMTAHDWFQKRGQVRQAFPTGFDVASFEVVPGQTGPTTSSSRSVTMISSSSRRSSRRSSERRPVTDIRAIPEAVQWHEGMLLSPQHFQQASLRSDLLLHFHLSQAAPFRWGVLALQTDQARLAMGTFRVLSLQAIMPDGLAVSYPHDDMGALELDLQPMKDRLRDAPARIYLAVPARRPDIVSGSGEAPRLRSVEGEETIDENTGDNPLRLPRLRPNLTLLAGEKPSAKYTAMPIAEVSFANDAFQLTPFLPPLLAVALDGGLGQLCLKLAQSVRQKASFLADRAQGAAGAARQASLLETRSAIQCLVGGLPAFEAALNTGLAHPFTLFLLAAGIAGQ